MRNASLEISPSYAQSTFMSIYSTLTLSGYVLEPVRPQYPVTDSGVVPLWCQEFRLKGYKVASGTVLNMKPDAPLIYVTMYAVWVEDNSRVGVSATVETTGGETMWAFDSEALNQIGFVITELCRDADDKLFNAYNQYGFTDYYSERR